MKTFIWAILVALLLASPAFAEPEEANIQTEEDKDVFVPSKFVTPKISDKGDLFLFDFFKSQDAIGKTWIKSAAKKDGVDQDIAKYNGEWAIQEPTTVVIEGDLGLTVKTKARHHAIATKLTKPFVFDEKPLVVQYEAHFEEGQECGGGYVKLLTQGIESDLATFQDKTPYTIMFGPDKCAPAGRVHLIFRYKNPKNGSIDEYHAKQPSNLGSTYWDDHKTHLYTLVVKPDGDFSVAVDQKTIISGNMITDLVPSLEPPKQIADPEDKKPADWDDREKVEDAEAVKPEDWDENEPKEIVDDSAVKPSDWLEEEPELIPDPEAVKPADWDSDMDGDWEPASIDNPACKSVSGCGTWKKPTIPNPKYKGKWIRPMIPNPAFKGVWTARLIDNPAYFEPTAFGGLAPISALGLELWTMSQDINFDNFLITDSEEISAEVAKQTYLVRKAEQKRFDASQKGGGVFQAVIDAANENPWLWAVYVLCLLIPIILLGVCCFGRKSSPDTSAPRKDASFKDDDKVPNLVDDDEVEVDDAQPVEEEVIEPVKETKKTRSRTPSASPSRKAKSAPQAMKDIEDDSDSQEGEQEVVEEEHEAEPEPVEVVKPTVTKRKPRRD